MSKIGIFGGTFNPIHLGHLKLAQSVIDEVKLDKILFVPDNTPPHKDSKDLASGTDRLNMINLLIKENDKFEASSIELEREGKSYTYETLKELKKIYPNDTLYLITGADMFLTLDKWREPKVIFENAEIIGVPRLKADLEKMKSYYVNVIKPMGAKAHILSSPVFETASSTFVRDNIDDFEKVGEMITPELYEYINANNLYRE